MKTSISSALLKEFLSYVGIPPVFLTAKDNYVRLYAWSNGVMFRAEYPSPVKEDGEFTLPSSVVSILKNVHKDVYIDMETTGKGIKIKADTIKLNSPQAEDIIFWKDEPAVIEYSTTVLPWMKILANNRAKKSYGIPATEGICFTNGMILALDGYRAAVFTDSTLDTQDVKYVLPKEGTFFLSKVGAQDAVKFSFGQNRITVTTPRIVGTMAQTAGNFPVPQSMGQTVPNELTVNAAEFSLILTQAASIHKDDDPPYVKLTTENGFMTVVATDGAINFEAKVPCLIAGDELDVMANTNYLLDYVGSMDGDIFMEYGTQMQMMVLHQKDNLRQYIMPLRK